MLNKDDLFILLIDVQQHFIANMHGDQNKLLLRLEHLLRFAGWQNIPVIATLEEPMSTIGQLPDQLSRNFPMGGLQLQKRFYNCCRENHIMQAISDTNRRTVVIAGAETDVCVIQSVTELLEKKYQVILLEDCLFSSTQLVGPALITMHRDGASRSTLKSLIYQVLQTIDHEEWPEGFVLPENWD